MLLKRLETISNSIEKKASVKKQLRVKTILSTRSSVLEKDAKKLSDFFLKLVEFEKLGLRIEVSAHAFVIFKNISTIKNKIKLFAKKSFKEDLVFIIIRIKYPRGLCLPKNCA